MITAPSNYLTFLLQRHTISKLENTVYVAVVSALEKNWGEGGEYQERGLLYPIGCMKSEDTSLIRCQLSRDPKRVEAVRLADI